MTGIESEARYSSIYVPLTVIISPRSTSIIRSVHSNLDSRMSSLNIHVSQGRIATRLRCGGKCGYYV